MPYYILTILYLLSYEIYTICCFARTNAYLESSRAIWSYLALPGATWGYLERSEAICLSATICSYLQLSGAICSYLKLSGVRYLKLSATI